MSEDTIGTGRCKTNKHAFDFNCLVCLQTLARESIEQDSRLRVKLAELESQRTLENAHHVKHANSLKVERDSLAAKIAELEAKLTSQASSHGLYITQTLEPKIYELEKQIVELTSKLAEAHQELVESARLHGMGSSREAALMAKLATAERELKNTKDSHNYCAIEHLKTYQENDRLKAQLTEVTKERDELKDLHECVTRLVLPGYQDSLDAYLKLLRDTQNDCNRWERRCRRYAEYAHKAHDQLQVTNDGRDS